MDIASHQPRPPMPTRTSSDEKISLATDTTIYTYHCLCTHLLLATTTRLPDLPTRQHCLDNAHIMPLPPPPAALPPARGAHLTPMNHYGLLLSTTLDPRPEILRGADGFEKRYLQRCGRCNLVVGYQLDWSQFDAQRSGRREDVVFLLPGGFVTTSEMVMGKPNAGSMDIGIGSVAAVKV